MPTKEQWALPFFVCLRQLPVSPACRSSRHVLPESMPTQMALPIVDETAAAIAQTLGYPVVEDSNLTKSLIAGMNRLNGWVTNFAPKIPFSMLPEYDSIVPFNGTNGATANLFFLDITDPAAPVTIMPDKYYRVVNFNRATEYPYYLSLRFQPVEAES